ncbi:MAG TPA: hypothetical protein ENH00_06390 [Actinobacteria bacterium]|nr:hypothetical protein BMS3Bbin01_02061 [bacterium BMS3Bbin01]HDH25808.1 hypothetical protein [Actinomycetota bacterium]
MTIHPGARLTDTGRRFPCRAPVNRDNASLQIEDGSCLPIQGPPGTGKTYTGAHQIVDLALAGRRVGVTAMSHAVITNLLDGVTKVASERGVTIRIGQRPGSDGQFVSQAAAEAELLFKSTDQMVTAFKDGIVDVVGGTTWVWTSDKTSAFLDVLLVDEAGQMSMGLLPFTDISLR